jgi:hypothetical protein
MNIFCCNKIILGILTFPLTEINSSLFDEFVCKLGFFGTRGPLKHSFHSRFKMAHTSETSVLKAHECQKRLNLHTNELNTTIFCSTSPLKAPNRLKPLKLA